MPRTAHLTRLSFAVRWLSLFAPAAIRPTWREFEPTAQSICQWVTQADRPEGRREAKSDGLTAAERDELARLRRENKQLHLERDILSRAAAWLARETGTIPSGTSNS